MQTSQIIRYGSNLTMRLTLLVLLPFLLLPLCSKAQDSKNVCGVYHKPSNELEANQPVDLIDQFGNNYTFQELNIRHFEDRYGSNGENRNVSNCTGGDFTLDFFGFTCDEETTICNVFQELSDIIDIGPNGSSPLVTIVKEPFQNSNGTNDTGTLGIGSALFLPGCGLVNNFIFDIMYTDIALPPGTAAGVLRINDLLPFYNDVQGPVAGHYDLHTVAMHEILHILGYSSLMANGGGPVNEQYSRWDTYLYSENDQEDLISLAANAPVGCCDLHEFNPSLNYNQVITATCGMNVYFRNDNGQNIARTNGAGYPTTSPGGLLSHLNRCGDSGDQFVMTSSLGAEDERDLTQEEIDIILGLGYQADGGATECNVIANDDFVALAGVSQFSFFTYDEIFGNDALPDGFDPLTDVTYHLSGCGTAADITGLQVIPTATSLILALAPCVSFDLCYTLNGCGGECDDGVIRIEKACPPCYDNLADCDPVDMCAGENLFCYGDFDQFIPNISLGEANLQLDVPFCSAFAGTLDIIYDPITGNRVVGMFAPNEGIIIPLSNPVQPGCSIDVSCRASGSVAAVLEVFGSSMSPCESNETASCPSNNQSDFQCIGTAPIVDGGVVATGNGTIPCDSTTPPDIDCTCTEEIPFYNQPTAWSNINLTSFVNNTDEAINFLYIRAGDPNPDPIFATYVLFDDLVVTSNCDNELTITNNDPVDVCRGQEGVVAVTVCVEGTNFTPNDLTLTANLPNLMGVNIIPGSAFDGGSTVIPNTVAGSNAPNCYSVDFNFQVPYNIPLGTQIEVSFDAVLANTCLSPVSLTNTVMTLVECDIPCVLESYPTITASCGNDGSIEVIVAGGSGNYTYQWSGGLGNTPSVSGLAPGTYEFLATDVTDTNCFVKGEFTVPVGEDCNVSCTGDGTITIDHKVVEFICLESEEPGFDRYYIDMYIPNWGGTQNANFELCSEDIFVTTPGVILESNESYLIQGFAALNIFVVIQVPTGTQIDQGICFETPVCIGAGQVCGQFCVTGFPICPAESCEPEVVPTVTLSPITNTTCGNLSGDDLYVGNVSLAIENANGLSIDYVQYIQLNGNADPTFWQENNVPVIGGVANLSDQAICWKSYDNQYFCFKVRIGYSDGIDHYECETNICLLLSDILSGMLDDGAGGERREKDWSFQKDKNINAVFPVFPNPVNRDLNIQNPKQTSVTLKLMTLQGKLLDQQALDGYAHTKMKANAYAPGIYLLEIRDASSGAILQIEKVVIAR